MGMARWTWRRPAALARGGALAGEAAGVLRPRMTSRPTSNALSRPSVLPALTVSQQSSAESDVGGGSSELRTHTVDVGGAAGVITPVIVLDRVEVGHRGESGGARTSVHLTDVDVLPASERSETEAPLWHAACVGALRGLQRAGLRQSRLAQMGESGGVRPVCKLGDEYGDRRTLRQRARLRPRRRRGRRRRTTSSVTSTVIYGRRAKPPSASRVLRWRE